jgi:hypothetical protein
MVWPPTQALLGMSRHAHLSLPVQGDVKRTHCPAGPEQRTLELAPM